MPELISELKAEHSALKALLLMIKDEAMSYEDQVSMVQTTKEKLLGHLQKEDAKLYPFLRKHADGDAVLFQKLVLLDKNMRQVTAKVLVFYDEYENGWPRSKRFSFIMDLAEITSLLDRRISVEEKTLYPEYDARMLKETHRSNPSVLVRLRRLFMS